MIRRIAVRRIAACATLLALVISLSACACGRAVAPAAKGTPASSGANASGGTVCLPTPCSGHHDCSACYFTEADRDVNRMRDDLPPGACCDCEPRLRHHHEMHDPCR